jgi:hypothetical protein
MFINVSISAQLMNVKTGDVVWSDASSQTTSLEDHAMAGLVAGMSQAAEQAITNLVSSMQGRFLQLQASVSKGIKEARQEWPSVWILIFVSSLLRQWYWYRSPYSRKALEWLASSSGQELTLPETRAGSVCGIALSLWCE